MTTDKRASGDSSAAQQELDAAEFVRLWTKESRRLLGFILTLAPNWTEAEDILQEVSATAWEKRSDFVPGTNFGAWAKQIARFKTLSLLKKRGRQAVPSEALAALLDGQLTEREDEFDRRHVALAECLGRLSAKDRQLVQLRYGGNCNATKIAESVGRSVGAIYTALHRVHRSLHTCVTTQMESAE